MRDLLSTSKGFLGVLLMGTLILAAIGADIISPLEPFEQNLRMRLTPPSLEPASNGLTYLLGTDQLGRDVFARILHGARISLLVGITAVLISGSIGILLGLLSGYYRGWLDSIVMRVVDMQLAMPIIVFALAWIGFFGASLVSVIIVIGVWGWVQYARFTRSFVISLTETAFVTASTALGASNSTVIFRHIAPNLIGPVIVMATLQVGHAVLLESALSFLGIGVQPPTPTWGGMVADGRNYIDRAWWVVFLPGLAITAFVLGANLLGDALRDVLDPKTV
ncbi:MAG: ABC transporter permease [Paracoccaceae bacterium]|nr:ABC transporter permease [Paracoccaceae bacterium]